MRNKKFYKTKVYDNEVHYRSKNYSFLPNRILNSLGKVSDAELARRHEVGVGTIKKARKARGIPRYTRRMTPEIEMILGTIPDSVLSKQYGVPLAWVAKERQLRGISVYNPKRDLYESEGFKSDLGTMSDSAFGKKYGISFRAACHQRIKHGIESHHHKMLKEKARGG
tara:strand:+ start:101 stop:604 length:504 start_codon:yes stop_codon:yes gene_type:complete